jgi:hypothetical protein
MIIPPGTPVVPPPSHVAVVVAGIPSPIVPVVHVPTMVVHVIMAIGTGKSVAGFVGIGGGRIRMDGRWLRYSGMP